MQIVTSGSALKPSRMPIIKLNLLFGIVSKTLIKTKKSWRKLVIVVEQARWSRLKGALVTAKCSGSFPGKVWLKQIQ